MQKSSNAARKKSAQKMARVTCSGNAQTSRKWSPSITDGVFGGDTLATTRKVWRDNMFERIYNC